MSDQYDGPAMAQHIYRLREQIARDTAEIEKLRGEVAALKDRLEIEAMRLAECSVAALGYFNGCSDEYRSASLDDVLRLRAKLDAAVLRKVRYEIASGETRGEMAAHCREGDLYKIGDAILVWVNEGDIIALGQRIDAAKEDK